jgi:hypothetical protein
MDYRASTNDSIIMMLESVRGALASDDAQTLPERNLASKFAKRLIGGSMPPI